MNYEILSCENGFIIMSPRDRSRSSWDKIFVAKSPSELGDLIKSLAISYLNRNQEAVVETP